MVNNPRLKYWPILFLTVFIEGGIALIWLALIPSETKTGVLLGFSRVRLLMMACIVVILTTSAFGGWISWRRLAWRERWLNPGRITGLFHWLTIGAFLSTFGLELTWLYLRFYDFALLKPLFIRSEPILTYLILICIQSAIWLLVLRFGREIWLYWIQSILWVTGWAIISLLAFWAFSPAGGGELHTWWYIQTFDPLQFELHGEDYCSADYSSSMESQYKRAKEVRLLLANIDRPRALLAIFNRITAGAKTNTEKQLKILEFIQKASYHTDSIASYSLGDWVYDPLVLLELGDMYCTQGAILAIDLFGAAGYPGRLVQLAHHQIAEIYYDGDWHYLDTDLFGNGETLMDNGNIPSVAEMSRADYQKLDGLPAFQETNVMDCAGPIDSGDEYPAYYYFSSQAYLTDVPQTYFVGLDNAYDFEHGWKAVDKIAPNDKVTEYDFTEQHTPTKPIINSVSVDPNRATLRLSFTATDPDGDLAGYQIFISDHSRGWDYNQFYGDDSAKVYWADPGGWKPAMYGFLFELPPSNMVFLELKADKQYVDIQVKHGITYYITVMPFDSYGLSVQRELFPVSNELKVAIP
jgi:hypothetical protein